MIGGYQFVGNVLVISIFVAIIIINNVDSSFCSKQQSSTDIWLAVCVAVKAACSKAKVAPTEVQSLGFAATCSLGMHFCCCCCCN